MKIGLVCPYPLDAPGGVREHVLGLYQEFKKQGHQVKIIFPGGFRKKPRKKDVIFLGIYFKIPSNKDRATITFCSNLNQKIQKMLKRQKFDILHFHEPFTPFSGFQILKESASLNIATFHACSEASSLAKMGKILGKVYLQKLAQKIHGAIAVSCVAKRYASYPDKRKIIIIPNGVDLNRFNPQVPKRKKFTDGKRNILFVGRLSERKGAIYLLKAFRLLKKKHQNTRLLIVGEGEQKKKLKDYVKTHKIEDVFFEGRISDKRLPSYYATADVFCSPASQAESFGVVLLEAMASGTPIVASANKGYKQVLKGFGKNCLVPPKNVKALAWKLEKVIENEELRKDLAKWGLEEAKKYSWEKVALRVLDFYQRNLEKKKALKV